MLPLYVEVEAEDKLIKSVTLKPSNRDGFELKMDGANRKLDDLLHKWVEAYFNQKLLPILPFANEAISPFTQKVLNILSTIPFGNTISYKQLAALTGKPEAARAVGSACGRNPFPFFIPCHRIVASDGSLGGFSGGLEIKRMLLDFEAKKVKS